MHELGGEGGLVWVWGMVGGEVWESVLEEGSCWG